jgi:hypothetical protein
MKPVKPDIRNIKFQPSTIASALFRNIQTHRQRGGSLRKDVLIIWRNVGGLIYDSLPPAKRPRVEDK